MRQYAVRQANDVFPARRIAVEIGHQQARMQHQVGIVLAPLPRPFAIAVGAAVPIGVEVQMPGRIDADDAVIGGDRGHQPLDHLGVAIVEVHRLRIGVDAVLVGMQFVEHKGRQAVGEHAVLVDGIGDAHLRQAHLFAIYAHQAQARPLLDQVAVVRQAAAEVAEIRLAVVDPPVDVVADILQVLQLAESP